MAQMLLETERLTIRSWQLSDTNHYLTLSKDVGYNCFSTPGYFSVQNEEEAAEKVQKRIALFEKQKLGKFLLTLKDTDEFIGTCGIDPYSLEGKTEFELGYRLCIKYWGQGYATEAAKEIVKYGFEKVGLSKIIAFALLQNQSSLKIIEKLGFKYERIFNHMGLPHKLYEHQI